MMRWSYRNSPSSDLTKDWEQILPDLTKDWEQILPDLTKGWEQILPDLTKGWEHITIRNLPSTDGEKMMRWSYKNSPYFTRDRLPSSADLNVNSKPRSETTNKAKYIIVVYLQPVN